MRQDSGQHRAGNEGSIRNYRDLIAWQKAMVLVRDVYRLSITLPREEQYGLKSQLRRAAVSIPCNISEGFGRASRADYLRFLDIARGSANEVETLLQLTADLGLTAQEVVAGIMDSTVEVRRIVSGLMRSLQASGKTGVR